MPRITPARRAAQRERIIDAMLASVQTKGLSATSMADVIEGSGLSAGAIYGYFPGKDQIVLATAERIVEDRTGVLETITRTRPVEPPHEVITRLLASLPAVVTRGGALLQVWGEAVRRPELRDVAVGVIGRLESTLRAYLEAWCTEAGMADPAEHARRSAPALMALIQGYLVRATLLGDEDPRAFAASVTALFATFPSPLADQAA